VSGSVAGGNDPSGIPNSSKISDSLTCRGLGMMYKMLGGGTLYTPAFSPSSVYVTVTTPAPQQATLNCPLVAGAVIVICSGEKVQLNASGMTINSLSGEA